MERLILASQSPRRRQLLEWACLDFDVVVSEAEENYPPHLAPADVAMFIAKAKAKAVQERLQTGRTIIAADTIVVLDGDIIGKPRDRADAISILSRLSGKTHVVITGVTIRTGGSEISFFDETRVSFHELTREQIEFYVDKFQPFDKAGAYAIQEWIGVIGIRSIQGDFYNVMGLPVSRVVQALNAGKKA